MNNKTRWEIYKEKNNTKPDAKIRDLFNKHNYTEDELSDARMEICNDCDRLIDLTKQCRECGCFMVLKTKLINASCPLGKWN